jgi:hypothetical protein
MGYFTNKEKEYVEALLVAMNWNGIYMLEAGLTNS